MARFTQWVTVASLSLLLLTPSALGGTHGAGYVSASWPKVSHLRDGSTVSVWASGHLIQRDRHGRIVSESWCESYAVYVRWVTFMRSVQAAVKLGEASTVARDIHYPLSGPGGVISNRQKLVSHFASVFRPSIVKAILAADPRALFCKNISQVALDDGVLWGDDFGGHLALFSVNPAVP